MNNLTVKELIPSSISEEKKTEHYITYETQRLLISLTTVLEKQ